jgi:membrane-associated phospholipid phosphatase
VLVNQRRTLLGAATLLAGAVAVGALLAVPATRPAVQSVDDSVLHFVGGIRSRPATLVAEAFSLVGSVWVNWPLRVLVALVLALRRRWLQLTAFGLAVLTSELAIGLLKALYDRPRPPGSLIATSAASFPSGHAIAGAVTAFGVVIMLVPPTRSRWKWGAWAVTFSFFMALSRVYLNAHWLSDVVAGGLLGAGLALGWPAALMTFVREPEREAATASGAAAAAGAAPP